MANKDFLSTRGTRAIRREIASIVDSYHHYWDPVAELLQNSRDAVQRSLKTNPQRKHFIRITIDPAKRSIEVMDNGVGIPHGQVQEVLGPGGGDKEVSGDEAGEKGVGLTYAIFSSDGFELETRHDGSHHGGTVENARTWLSSGEGGLPQYHETDTAELTHTDGEIEIRGETYDLTTFTRIRLEQLPYTVDEKDFFSFTYDQLKMLLTTRTAVGVTGKLFDTTWKPPFTAFLRLVGSQGPGSDYSPVEVGFPRFHEFVQANQAVTVSEAGVQLTRFKDEKRKTRLLRNKTIWDTRSLSGKQGEKIRVYGVMFPGNQVFSQLGKDLGIEAENDRQDNELVSSGIFVATKGMPTGVSIPEGSGGRYPAYYKRCYFLVESNAIRFDLGRKSMHYRPLNRLQEAVADMFRSFEALAPYQAPSRVKTKPGGTGTSKAERDAEAKARWKKYKDLVDLKLDRIAYAKQPDRQEAAVAAIFHELLGAKVLEKYVPLHTGYGVQYDLHALYRTDSGPDLELVIEFKFALETVVQDLASKQKYFDDLHMLVAWDADEQKLKDANFLLDRAPNGALEGATHELDVPVEGIDPIPVILLRDLVNRVK